MMVDYSNSEQELEDPWPWSLVFLQNQIAQIKELKDRDPAAAREKRLKDSREELVELRDKLTNLLKQDWKQFRDVQKVISAYVFLLHTFPFQCDEIWSDKSDDLDILKELQAKLENEYAEAKKNYYNVQFSFLYAVRKRATMLRELHLTLENHHTSTTDEIAHCFRGWPEFRQLLDVDWNDILEFADDRKEGVLMIQAKKNGDEVQFLKQPINSDQIDVDNPKLVIDQFTVYEKKENEASSEMGENLNVYIHSPPACKAVKDILLRLERMLLRPDDDIKVDEECQEVHRSVQPDDGAKLL
ncbi:hypothetical protein MKW98_026790 [Papaver atlanticum]|uniref:Uncharacterized protein n=1 Tax=Papaver atlanticum TaxID=357466 RepID=A0AAD4RZZ3_9MAGN|nr:hypothetical protein MKW98_026790 [Papaver atlanticum]